MYTLKHEHGTILRRVQKRECLQRARRAEAGTSSLSLSLAKMRDTSEGQRGYQFAPPLQTMLKERKERGG